MCPAGRFCLCSILFLCQSAPCGTRSQFSPHLAFISKWWRGTMVALFSVPLFFLLPFFLHQSSSSLIRQTALHIWLHSATRDRFFFLSLTDKRRLFDRKFVFSGPRIMYLRLETLVVKIWCMLLFFKKFWNFIHLISYF